MSIIDGRLTANAKVLSNKMFDLTKSLGQTAMNSLYPNEFEVYFLSLELVDSERNTVDYFMFPITPQQISRSTKSIKSIEKTQYGINVEKNSTFAPVSIKLTGNFGRTFKIQVGKEKFNLKAFLTEKGTKKSGEREFSTKFKTGFGCFKALDDLIKKSKSLDQYEKPHSLILFNPIFSDSHIVEVVEFSVLSNASNLNRLHQYSMDLVAVAPISAFAKDEADLKKIKKSQNTQILNGLKAKLAFTTAKNVHRVLRIYGDDGIRKGAKSINKKINDVAYETRSDIDTNGFINSKVGKPIKFLTQGGLKKTVQDTGKGISAIKDATFKQVKKW